MRRSLRNGMIITCAVAAGVMLGVAGTAQGQDKAPGPSAAGRGFSAWAVVQPVTGSFQKVDSYLAGFMKEFSGQGLDASLVGFDPTSILVLYEDPTGKQEVRMAVGFTVPAALRVKEPLRLEHFQFPQVTSQRFQGPYESLGQVHARLSASLKQRAESSGWPVIVKLLNDPRQVKREAIQSELVVPAEPAARTAALSQASLAKIQQAVRAPRAVSYNLIGESFTGSVTQLGDFLHKFMNDFSAQGLGKNLASRDVAPVALLYGNPDQQKQIRIVIGLPVKDRVPVREPLAFVPFSAPQAVDYVLEGQYSQLSAVHGQITQAVHRAAPNARSAREPGWPVALRLLTDPEKVQPPRTELIVPLGAVK